jgi:hypothetical protein
MMSYCDRWLKKPNRGVTDFFGSGKMRKASFTIPQRKTSESGKTSSSSKHWDSKVSKTTAGTGLYMFIVVYICLCTYICMYVCMHACMHVCLCIYIYVYLCLYIYRLWRFTQYQSSTIGIWSCGYTAEPRFPLELRDSSFIGLRHQKPRGCHVVSASPAIAKWGQHL